MSKHFYQAISLAVVVSMIFGITGCGTGISASVIPTVTSTVIPTKFTPTPPPNSASQPTPDQDAWLDESIDILQFSPTGNLVIHFKESISSANSAKPVLSWPNVEGTSSWNESHTILTFSPTSILDSQKTYTFFLDPGLRFTDGSEIENVTGWVLHLQDGVKVLKVTPQSGTLDRRFQTIEISFDRNMVMSNPDVGFSIEPQLPFEISWKNTRVLQVKLQKPFTTDQRYDLLLKGGKNETALLAQDGTYLAEDYLWFYWQTPFEVIATTTGHKTAEISFNYSIDKTKSGLPFSISPELNGKWIWAGQKAVFTADKAIPASTEFMVTLNAPLMDINGFEMPEMLPTTFTGVAPIRLINDDIEKSPYSDAIFAERDVESIKIEFDGPVNHLSAEKAFSLTPTLPGSFQWEKSRNGTNDVLVYILADLLKPQTSYTVKIDTSVVDIAGNKIIAQPYRISFEMPYWGYLNPSFGEAGANIQVVDTNGTRRLQISGNDPDISFTAYRFDMIDYANLYANYYHYRTYGGNMQDIPVPPGLKPTLTWKNVSMRDIGSDQKVFETIVPPELPPGLYVLNLNVKGRLYDQLFLTVSANTLVVKKTGDDLFIWLTNINGTNIADAEIRVYSADGEKIREGITDENGLYKVSIPTGKEPELVFARIREKDKAEDIAIAGFGGWKSKFAYDYNDKSYLLPIGRPYLLYLYTERPIYKPGQIVNYKVIVRKDDDLRYGLVEANTPVNIRVLDARKNTIETANLLTNEFGTVNGSVNITDGAMLGLYTIETEVNGVIQTEFFQVEDYRKPDYQINITSLQPEKENRFVNGEEVRMQINVSYYFGAPLANTKLDVDFFVTWPVTAKINGPVVTDENGNATLIFKAPYDEDLQTDYYGRRDFQGQLIRMEVTANDGSNQTVTGVYNFKVYPASEILSLSTSGYYFSPTDAITITTQALDIFDNPVATRSLTLTTHSWNRNTFDFNDADQTFTLTTDAKGMASQEIKLNSGYHKLVLSGKDDQGHETEATRWIYVFKNRNDWFFKSQDEQLLISAEKDSYKPYERASFAIESTFSGPALVTFERGSVINYKLIELTAPLTIFETDIIPEHAPNVYVTVNAWQAASDSVHRYRWWYGSQTEADSYLRVAKTQIQVDASTKELDISITTDQKTYEPGGTVKTTINIKDDAGNPVMAELSLAVVDEAIFGLADDNSQNIFDAFYGPRAHTVDTSDSMSPYRIVMEGGMGGGNETPPAAARSNFPDTSAWLPVIVTDSNGQASITFDLPDNTTSWRLTVKAVTLTHKVGQSYINIESKKDVFVRPILPRILTNGDVANLTAFVHNNSSNERILAVSLFADGLEVQGKNEEIVTLQPGEILPIGWQVRVNKASATEVHITVHEGDMSLDAVRLPLLIQPAAVRDVQNLSGQISGTAEIPLILPNVELESSHVYLTLNTSVGGTLLNGLEYLTGYPYGCVEQTMSRALPNAVVGRASEQLGIGGPALQQQVDPLINASIVKLYSLQHSDGGWGWWTDDASDEYQTAWVLFGLGVMKESGYNIEPKVIDNASKWLKDNIEHDQTDIRTRAYSLYSLAQAGQGDLAATQLLASTSSQELDPFSQATLALALHKLGDVQNARKILDLLSQSAVESGGMVYFPQPTDDGYYHRKTMSSTVRTTAIALLAFAKIDPQNSLVPGMVEYLSSKRQGIYGWGTTNETSFTILALTEYLMSQEKELGDSSYEVFVNEKQLFAGVLGPGYSSIRLDVPLVELNSGLNKLAITTQGTRPLYFDLSTSYDLFQENVDAAGKIKVARSYLDPTTNKPIQTIQAGQLVKVSITVQVPENTYFVAVEDFLPGGLEALNEGLNSTSQVGYGMWGQENYSPFHWEEYGYNYKEIRGDRVIFFITNFEKGKRTFTYFTRAITEGDFTVLSTQVYAMYDQSMWGRSQSAHIEVR